MGTANRIEAAIEKLKRNEHQVGMPAIREDGKMVFAVDGIYRTYAEIYDLADNSEETPPPPGLGL